MKKKDKNKKWNKGEHFKPREILNHNINLGKGNNESNSDQSYILVWDTGLPVPDMVTVVNPDDVEAVDWFTDGGTGTPGGGWSGSTEDRSFRCTAVDTAELVSELVPSLSLVDGTVGWVTWCFWKKQ